MEALLKEIKRNQDAQVVKLNKIEDAVAQIAVQDERIAHLESNTSALWEKMDTLLRPDGVLSAIKMHQASCPRNQIRWLWCVVLPMGLTQLTVGITLVGLFFKP